jgi:hypothetical protein
LEPDLIFFVTRKLVCHRTFASILERKKKKIERMGFLTSFCCCCFYRPSQVSSDGVDAVSQRLMPNFIETKAAAPILVPHFPVNSNLSRL